MPKEKPLYANPYLQNTLTAEDGHQINMTVWNDVTAMPKGIVLIVHTMSECAERYKDFAAKLNEAGYIAIGLDLRGHGVAAIQNLGKTDKNHFDKSKLDVMSLAKSVRIEYTGLPLYLFAHGYGSFLAQALIKSGQLGSSLLSGVILSGTTVAKDIRFWLARKRSYFKATRKSGNKEGHTFGRIFRGHDFIFREGINGWLSSDCEAVGEFNTGSLTGFLCDNNFFRSYFVGLKKLAKAKFDTTASKDMPIFIIGGSKDCLSWFGRGAKKLCQAYSNKGFAKVECKIYEGVRHDLLFEKNRDEVVGDIIAMLNNNA